jgi:hypothetical protein
MTEIEIGVRLFWAIVIVIVLISIERIVRSITSLKIRVSDYLESKLLKIKK